MQLIVMQLLQSAVTFCLLNANIFPALCSQTFTVFYYYYYYYSSYYYSDAGRTSAPITVSALSRVLSFAAFILGLAVRVSLD
jgi:hypothetical protein